MKSSWARRLIGVGLTTISLRFGYLLLFGLGFGSPPPGHDTGLMALWSMAPVPLTSAALGVIVGCLLMFWPIKEEPK